MRHRPWTKENGPKRNSGNRAGSVNWQLQGPRCVESCVMFTWCQTPKDGCLLLWAFHLRGVHTGGKDCFTWNASKSILKWTNRLARVRFGKTCMSSTMAAWLVEMQTSGMCFKHSSKGGEIVQAESGFIRTRSHTIINFQAEYEMWGNIISGKCIIRLFSGSIAGGHNGH